MISTRRKAASNVMFVYPPFVPPGDKTMDYSINNQINQLTVVILIQIKKITLDFAQRNINFDVNLYFIVFMFDISFLVVFC